jgi:hypothetical protein
VIAQFSCKILTFLPARAALRRAAARP